MLLRDVKIVPREFYAGALDMRGLRERMVFPGNWDERDKGSLGYITDRGLLVSKNFKPDLWRSHEAERMIADTSSMVSMNDFLDMIGTDPGGFSVRMAMFIGQSSRSIAVDSIRYLKAVIPDITVIGGTVVNTEEQYWEEFIDAGASYVQVGSPDLPSSMEMDQVGMLRAIGHQAYYSSCETVDDAVKALALGAGLVKVPPIRNYSDLQDAVEDACRWSGCHSLEDFQALALIDTP